MQQSKPERLHRSLMVCLVFQTVCTVYHDIYLVGIDLYITDIILPGPNCDTTCLDLNPYYPNSSSTAVMGPPYNITAGDGSNDVGTLFTDTVTFAGLSVKDESVRLVFVYVSMI
jgi:Eukaryotic aspartyl protease